MYASEGETVILKCKVYSNNKSTWYKIESNDSKEYQTITPYADGKEINPGLPNEQNLAIIGNINEGDYNLQIQHVSSNDEGVYICSRTRNGTDVQEFNITLKMTGKPFTIHIIAFDIQDAKTNFGREDDSGLVKQIPIYIICR